MALTAAAVISAAGCGETAETPGGVNAENANIGALTGSTGEMFVEANYPDAGLYRYDSIPDAVVALKSERLDYVVTAYTIALGFVRSNPDLEIMPGILVEEGAAIAVKKDETQLLSDISEVLERFRGDGTLDDIIERWIKEDGGAYEQREIPVHTDAPVLMVGVAANREPMCFIERGGIIGLDAELIERIAYELGMRVEYMDMQFSALITALESGRVGAVISNVTPTEERRLMVNFTEDYFKNPQILLGRKPHDSDNGAPRTLIIEEWEGKTIGVVTGTVNDQVVAEFIPGAVPAYFNDVTDAVLALRNGRINGVLTDTEEFKISGPKNPGLRILEPYFNNTDAGMLVSKEKPELLAKLNDFIALIKSDGVYDEMYDRWIGGDETMPYIPEGNGETLIFGTSGVSDGFAYYKDGEIAGFDIEFAKRFAAHEDMKLDIIVMDFSGLIPALQSGRVDYAASCFAITEERKQSANFTDPYFTTARAIAVFDRNSDAQAGGNNAGGFWNGLKTSFERNLIHEGRWKMIADGLRVSIIITIFSFALATLLGFGVCALRMSGYGVLRVIGNIYITVLRGTPVVVLLMITFYVIFARSGMNGTMVAVIAFGFNGAAFIGEIIRSAIMTIDKGQVEAARSMGFSRAGAFFTVTFPQAARVAFPVYMSEFISMFKMTSVVGYIAVVDLTKAGDIIRSRTYDAFFPLIMVALVYLTAASLMIWLFNYISRRTNKRLRRAK
ncbi:MAG: ABC transporter permease subunit [Oscillospiraceae bacterium]|nr:ABC transporter permease subunit [Oscillospiraceae bacterium]